MTHRVCVLTTSRADYGIYRSVLAWLDAEPEIELVLAVGGMHLSEAHGSSVERIAADGYRIGARVEAMPADDSDLAVADAMAGGVAGFARAFAEIAPDIVVALGDRYEMHAGVLAALPLGLPVAHIHGGDETEGAIDNSLRHSMTKLSHLHFPATELARERILLMGEPPGRVVRVGAPALDAIAATDIMPRAELLASVGMADTPFLLLTYHPETADGADPVPTFDALWPAIRDAGLPVLASMSNADRGGAELNARFAEVAAQDDAFTLVPNLGAHRYYSAMAHAEAMVGNSSSGIVEAASLGLPVINIGDRQLGRERSANTLDVPSDAEALREALRTVLTPGHGASLAGVENIYGDGRAAPRIGAALVGFLRDSPGIRKRFHMSCRPESA